MRISRHLPDLVSLGRSPRVTIGLCAAGLAVPLSIAGVVFAEFHSRSTDAVAVIRHDLDPASDAAEHLATAVKAQSAAHRGYLLTGDPAYLRELDAGTAELAETLSELNRHTASTPDLHLDLVHLENELTGWLAKVRPPALAPAGPPAGTPQPMSPEAGTPPLATPLARTPGAANPYPSSPPTAGPPVSPPAAGPRPVSPQDVRATDTGRLGADTRRLAEKIAAERDQVRAEASFHQDAMLGLVTSLAIVLLTLVGLLVVLASRCVAAPIAMLERRVEAASRGDLACPARLASGWLGGLSAEVDRVRVRMQELRWAARRDREALTQNGEAVLGLSDFLVSHTGPGRGVDAAGYLVAAEGLMAGDFWDILPRPDGTTALLQGDVSGHGVHAGLVAARAKIRASTALSMGHGPQAAVEAAWDALADEDERFVTLAIAVLDPADGILTWVNAGHEPPLVRRADGRIESLDATGPLVSSMITPAERPWDTARTRLAPDDLLVLVTDGLTEARAAGGEEFGPDRVRQTLHELRDPGAQDAVRALYLAADRHGIDWQRDDITVLAARLAPAAPSER
ncbi:SpoIIE family protein phosphatase [Kitasatospora sp. NPDC057015]|uniref:SpoIIE family protein phosphatase n=1 Tax=Kitasatospora sp. NPDC057015 TaxID=3346001 RepID=UPI003627F0F5